MIQMINVKVRENWQKRAILSMKISIKGHIPGLSIILLSNCSAMDIFYFVYFTAITLMMFWTNANFM